MSMDIDGPNSRPVALRGNEWVQRLFHRHSPSLHGYSSAWIMDHAVSLTVITNRCAIAAAICEYLDDEQNWTALYFYDTLLTFSDSVELIWQRKIAGASVLYIANRYLMIPYLILELIAINDTANCESIDVYVSDWKLPMLVYPLCSFSSYSYSQITPQILPPPLNCTMHSAVTVGLNNTREGSNLISNTVSSKSVVTRLLLNGSFHLEGSIYFVVHLILNVVDAVLTATGIYTAYPFTSLPEHSQSAASTVSILEFNPCVNEDGGDFGGIQTHENEAERVYVLP
ncbi:uncharacterized protein B0H18DRAFT_953142 [Fomitopsis serialis]|uniref:uncharacterized protein n=1 Tax=Fomitopsis serialis TaxID=139415 RepID=UPI002007B247|nr:uncharacterized protein B0H18DRAFT_953142 [Neoantrodia serialis]KAH9930776.1 hypothetical protein B0H18DRAFT_953142 [Neoantrodia serialis]